MLPPLHADPKAPGSLVGTLPDAGDGISLRVTPDDVPAEQCLVLAQKAVAALADLDAQARAVAAKSLLASYNQDWRHYARVAADGSTAETHDPELTPAEFEARLRMTCLEASGADCCTVFYDDGGMFAGHAVVVTSFDGLAFTDTHAELFG